MAAEAEEMRRGAADPQELQASAAKLLELQEYLQGVDLGDPEACADIVRWFLYESEA